MMPLDQSKAQRLTYESQMLHELGKMARNDGCDILAYMIEMASAECDDLQKQKALPTLPERRQASIKRPH